MWLATEGLNTGEDGPDYVADVILVQDSGRCGYDNIPNQSPPQLLPSPRRPVTPLKFRIMTFEYHSSLGSSKDTLRAAGKRMRLDLQEARKNVSKERPAIFVAQRGIEISVFKNFLNAVADADATLPIASIIGVIYLAHARDRLSPGTLPQTVLAASQPFQLELENAVKGLSGYFTLASSGFENDTSEHEILCFYGRTNFNVLMDLASKYAPKFSTGGRDMYRLEKTNTAAEYINSQIWDCVRHIVRLTRPQLTTAEILLSPACHNDAYSHSVIARLSQSFQTRSPASRNAFASTERHFKGDWLLERPEYIAWRHNDRPSTFWLSGSPGSGKSTLTSYVIEDLKSEQSCKAKCPVIVHYFHDARYRVSALASMVLRQIIYGLLPRQKQNLLRERLQSILEAVEDDDSKISVAQLRSYFAAVQRTITVGDMLVLVLDGIDEVEESDNIVVEELLHLTQHQDVAHSIKCFFSGNVFWRRRGIVNSSERVDIDDVVGTRPDLECFVKSEVVRASKSRYCARAFYEKLTASSDGVFCRAVLALRSLWRMDISDRDQVFSFINSIPRSLSTAYHDMLYNIGEADRKRTFKLIALVTYTFRPLLISELIDAMNFDLGKVYPGHLAKRMSLCDLNGHNYTENDILRLSAGLLAFGQDQTVNFIHNSVRDFILVQSSQSKSSSLCMSECQAHEMLIRTCFYFLQPIHNTGNMNSPKKTEVVDGFKDGKYHYFTLYATQYWSHHYRAAEARNDHLPGLLQNLIRQNLEHLRYDDGGCSDVSARQIVQDSVRAGLCIGTKVGSVKLVKMLLETGVDPDVYVDFAGNNALHIAAASGNLGVVNLLLKRGARFDLQSGITGRTALQYAAAAGQTSVIKLLLHTERVTRNHKVGSSVGYTPLRTIWVVCEANNCRFPCEQLSKARLGDSEMISDETHAASILNPVAPKNGLTQELPVRLPIISHGNIDTLRAGYKSDWIRSDLEQLNSTFRTNKTKCLGLKFLIRTLIQGGIESISEYDADDKVSMVDHVVPVQTLRSGHLHLLINVRDGESMAHNWGKALVLAAQEIQEDSVRYLLDDEVVAPPKIFSSLSTRFEDIGEKDEWDFGFNQSQNFTSWTSGELGYKKERDSSRKRNSNRDHSPE